MKELCVEKTASRGIAVAPIFKYEALDLTPEMTCIEEDSISEEKEAFAKVKASVMKDLEELAKESEIFEAHLEIADDFMLEESVNTKIESEHKNVQYAVSETVEEIAEMFAMIDDEYMRERSADVKDVGKRYMAKLKGQDLPDLGLITKEVVVIAKDMYPSDTVKLNPEYVKGIITEEGGVTSHVCIMANSMNIPIIVGASGILAQTQHDEMICMDANNGQIYIQPTDEIKVEFEEKKQAYLVEKQKLEALRNQKITDKNGKPICLCANIGDVEELRYAMKTNIHGVGLFRSEFLYMENGHFPTEEEQYAVYSEAARICPQELTIRTLDIGGDKSLPYYEFEQEENPFLGWRAIRISLELKEMFKEQLRAILRASAFGNVRIMFPMIIAMEELLDAKAIVEECKAELRAEEVAFDEQIQIGMMIETPASVLLADEFAKEVQFFSIGTNDLTQYLLAVDRGNKKIADRYSYFHPAVVRAIKHVISAGHEAGIVVGMCGEMAGDTKATELLMDMGLDEFSMSAGSVDYVRACILDLIK
ncbi:MAG: phosphoenolpyruvate--protein phosphotransferase [Eubacteriales bacterium]